MAVIGLVGSAVSGAAATHQLATNSAFTALALGLGAPFWIFSISLFHARVAFGGRGAWAVARRAGVDATLDAFVDRTPFRALLATLAVAAIGVATAVLELPAAAQAIVPGATALLVVAVIGAILGRIVILVTARRLHRTLETATLSGLADGSANVELALRVADDTPRVDLPFLDAPVAAAQLRYGSDYEHVQTWPERVAVYDASGRAELDLGSFEICGWRLHRDVWTWTTEDRPPVVDALETAIGASVAEAGQTSLAMVVWAVMPGDEIYVVGERAGVRRAFDGYRGAQVTALGTRSTVPAIAIVGNEERLERAIRRELLAQVLVAAGAAASLPALVCALTMLLP